MSKSKILLFGCGGVGTIAALNLESGNEAEVHVVLRSSFTTVSEHGFQIKSCDHGTISNWKPTKIFNKIPEAGTYKYDFVVCSTKNIPDSPPPLATQIAAAVTPGHTVLVLIQNGLNIEKPLISAYPQNIILSGISMIGSHEPTPGIITHDDPDILHIGAFHNPSLALPSQTAAAKAFVRIYAAGGKTQCVFVEDVKASRWRKLVYNTCLNSICAITGLDTGRIRLAGDAVERLVRPAMEEVRACARASGVELDEGVVDYMIGVDPIALYLQPSMLVDVKKGNLIEFENIIGEPLREGRKLGVKMPTIEVLYNLCKAIQWRAMEERGMIEIPPRGT